jgi:hypothetical protein
MLLSTLALYQYDDTLFDELQLPDGLDRDTVINNILFNTAELEVLYPNPDTLRAMIGVWSSKNMYNWTRLYTALTEEYNALHNFDRYEVIDETIGTTRDNVHKSSGSASAQSSNNGKSFEAVSGYNDSSMVDHTKNTSEASGSSSSSGSNTDTINDKENVKRGSNNHLYGNIGVTTPVQMLTGEAELRTRYNMTDIITTNFKQTFCLMIY